MRPLPSQTVKRGRWWSPYNGERPRGFQNVEFLLLRGSSGPIASLSAVDAFLVGAGRATGNKPRAVSITRLISETGEPSGSLFSFVGMQTGIGRIGLARVGSTP